MSLIAVLIYPTVDEAIISELHATKTEEEINALILDPAAKNAMSTLVSQPGLTGTADNHSFSHNCRDFRLYASHSKHHSLSLCRRRCGGKAGNRLPAPSKTVKSTKSSSNFKFVPFCTATAVEMFTGQKRRTQSTTPDE